MCASRLLPWSVPFVQHELDGWMSPSAWISRLLSRYMGIGICQKDVSLNRLPGESEESLSHSFQCPIVGSRLGSQLIWIPRRRRKLLLLLGFRCLLRSHLHYWWRYRLRSKYGEKLVFLHQKRPKSGNCLHRPPGNDFRWLLWATYSLFL